MASLQESLSRLVIHHTVHDEVYVFYSVTDFGDNVTLDEPFGFEFLKVLRVEVVIPVLEEPVDSDGILIEKLGQLSLQSRWQDLQKIRHFLIGLKLKVSIVVRKVVSQLIHQVGPNLKLLVQLVYLLYPLLVGGESPIDLTELRTQVREDVREYGHTENYDD